MTDPLSPAPADREKRPSFQFYPYDWKSDLKLRRCSPAARGVWVDVLCAFHDSDDGYGFLRWTLKEIARTVGASMAHVKELVEKGVLRGSDTAITEPLVHVPRSGRKSGPPVTLIPAQPGPLWYSKRMVKDEYVRTARGVSTRFDGTDGEAIEEHQSHPPNASPKGGLGEGQSDGSSSSSSSSTSSIQPPNPPAGGDASPPKRARRTRDAAPRIGLKAWLEGVKAKGEKAVPEGDPVFAYAERVGLPSDFLALAWAQFKHRYCVQHPSKRYSDWRRVFRNAVEGNWLKLWWLDLASNGYVLTTTGQQAKRDHDGRKAA